MIEIITTQDIENMYLETEHGMFTPMYTYKIYNSETETYQGFEVLKTAEEVYQEWLNANFDFIDGEWIKKEQIDICEPTDRERMDQLEGMVGMLAEQVARQSLGM